MSAGLENKLKLTSKISTGEGLGLGFGGGHVESGSSKAGILLFVL